MQEQISLIVSILTTILTGGFLMLFIENQHLGTKVTEAYHNVMDPFMHRFSGYVRFISSIKTWYHVNKGVTEGYAVDFKNLLEKLGREGSRSIMSGRDIPITHYTPEEFTDVCESMNHVWYYWDDKQNYMQGEYDFDGYRANHFNQFTRQYLNEAVPNAYDEQVLSVALIADVSGKLYCDMYQPLKDYPYQYRHWQQQEQKFTSLIIGTVFLSLSTLGLILLIRYFVPVWIFTLLTMASMVLLGYTIFKLFKLVELSKKLFR